MTLDPGPLLEARGPLGRVRRASSLLLAVCLLVTACGGSNDVGAVDPTPTPESGGEATPTPAASPATTPSATPEPPLEPTATPEPSPTTAPTLQPTAAPTATPTPAPSIDDLVFAADGLGLVDFGTDAEQALEVLVGLLGEPEFDTGWGDPSDPASDDLWPGCPGSVARLIAWPGILGIGFTDWDPSSPDRLDTLAEPYFAGAGLHPDTPIRTAEGAGPGDTLGALRAIYGSQLVVSDEPEDQAVGLYSWSLDTEVGPLHRLGGVRGWLFWPGSRAGAAPEGPPTDDWTAEAWTSGMSCDTP